MQTVLSFKLITEKWHVMIPKAETDKPKYLKHSIDIPDEFYIRFSITEKRLQQEQLARDDRKKVRKEILLFSRKSHKSEITVESTSVTFFCND